jgi:hypothetical protein
MIVHDRAQNVNTNIQVDTTSNGLDKIFDLFRRNSVIQVENEKKEIIR